MGLGSTRNEIPPVLPQVLPDKVPGVIHGESVVILELGKKGAGKLIHTWKRDFKLGQISE